MNRLRRLARLLAVAASVIVGVTTFAQPAQAASHAMIHYGTSMCLQPLPDYAAGESIYSNGVTIAQVACNGSPEQQWQLQYLGEAPHPTCSECNYGSLYYVVNLVSGQCIDVTDAATYNGARIQQWTCNGGGSEKWWVGFYYSHGGYRWREFINSRTKKCLDVPDNTSSQVALQQYGCNGTTAQIFSMW